MAGRCRRRCWRSVLPCSWSAASRSSWRLWAAAGALLLIVFLIAATPLYHNLFMFQGKERDPHLYLTLVNITLCGGLLLVIADTL